MNAAENKQLDSLAWRAKERFMAAHRESHEWKSRLITWLAIFNTGGLSWVASRAVVTGEGLSSLFLILYLFFGIGALFAGVAAWAASLAAQNTAVLYEEALRTPYMLDIEKRSFQIKFEKTSKFIVNIWRLVLVCTAISGISSLFALSSPAAFRSSKGIHNTRSETTKRVPTVPETTDGKGKQNKE